MNSEFYHFLSWSFELVDWFTFPLCQIYLSSSFLSVNPIQMLLYESPSSFNLSTTLKKKVQRIKMMINCFNVFLTFLPWSMIPGPLVHRSFLLCRRMFFLPHQMTRRYRRWSPLLRRDGWPTRSPPDNPALKPERFTLLIFWFIMLFTCCRMYRFLPVAVGPGLWTHF